MPTALYSALLITGTIIEPDDDDPSSTRKYTYQRVGKNFGNRRLSASRDLQRRRHVIPADNPTNYQLALRARFRDAMLAWHTLDSDEKARYKTRAEENHWTTLNQHMREYARAHPLDPDDYPDGPPPPSVMQAQRHEIHRAGALPGVARVTNPRALEAKATHPTKPPDKEPPLHVPPGQLRK